MSPAERRHGGVDLSSCLGRRCCWHCVVAVVTTAAAHGTRWTPPLVEPVEIAAAKAPAGPPPVEVLRAWDAQRAEAWARGDMRLLSALYTRDSVAGRRDRAMLRAWLARGLVVRGLQTQLLEVREVRRTASIWTLIVTDRLVGGSRGRQRGAAAAAPRRADDPNRRAAASQR